MPYDPFSIGVAVLAGILLWAAAIRQRLRVRIGLIVLAAFLIRADAGWQHSLHQWDESFHALVAKNLIEEPLKPTLYRQPAIDYDYQDWTANHVWLHKPPLALWSMAFSMNVFGVSEIPLRLPSVLLSSAAVLLTFLIGRLLFSERVALLAAGFHAVNGFLVALASGRRVADHIDTALIFWIELGIWAVLSYQRSRHWAFLGVAGGALGLGLLSKSLPALLVVAVAFVVFVQRDSFGAALRRCAIVLSVGCAVAAPWTVYISSVFPREVEWTGLYTLMHLSQALEGHDVSSFQYLLDMPRFFGELVWLPVGLAVFAAIRARDWRLRTLVVWVAVPYVVFSMASTRLPGYVMSAAPALFLIQAYVWCGLRDKWPTLIHGWHRAAVAVLLFLLVVLPARYLLEPTGSFERRDRNPAATQELRTLVDRIGLQDAVIFNMLRPIDAMFYSPYTVYSKMPTREQVDELTARGRAVVIYQPLGERVETPSDWPVILLPQMAP